MKITIEIDVQPDELRRFLGLPDIVGLQEDIISYMKEKAAAAADLSPADFVKQNLDSFGVTSTFKKFVHGARKATGLGDDDDDEEDGDDAPVPRRRRGAGAAGAGAEPARSGPDAEEPLASYDESSQTAAPTPTPAGERERERERGDLAGAIDTAEEIGAALAAVPRRALRSLRARAPRFNFNLDAARERRAQARGGESGADDDLDDDGAPDAPPAPPSPAPPAGTGGGPGPAPERSDQPGGSKPAPGDPDEIF